jgi:hypothetical protein
VLLLLSDVLPSQYQSGRYIIYAPAPVRIPQFYA